MPRESVHLEPDPLLERLEQQEYAITRARSRVEWFRLPRIEVFYEELVGRREETLTRILRFLGVEPRLDELDSEFVRINDVPSAELIENLDEVRAALAGTHFEWMLRT